MQKYAGRAREYGTRLGEKYDKKSYYIFRKNKQRIIIIVIEKTNI